MKNDISNLYWPGLYNFKFVHNCSGSMLVATSRSDRNTENCIAVKSYIRHKQLSVVWIEHLSNFKHFHISAMSNNRIKPDYKFFAKWQLSLQLV